MCTHAVARGNDSIPSPVPKRSSIRRKHSLLDNELMSFHLPSFAAGPVQLKDRSQGSVLSHVCIIDGPVKTLKCALHTTNRCLEKEKDP
jgi:hypothetical protein